MTILRHFEGDPDRRVVTIPGMGYTADAPLLWFARCAALQAGWSVTDLAWDDVGKADIRTEEGTAEALELVHRNVSEALGVHQAATTVLVAKSLGTLAMGLAAERGLSGVWLTPVNKADIPGGRYEAKVVRDLTGPQLFVAGTADRGWDRSAIPEVHRVLEIPGANHAMHIDGDVLASLDVLREVTEEVSAFLEGFVGGTA